MAIAHSVIHNAVALAMSKWRRIYKNRSAYREKKNFGEDWMIIKITTDHGQEGLGWRKDLAGQSDRERENLDRIDPKNAQNPKRDTFKNEKPAIGGYLPTIARSWK